MKELINVIQINLSFCVFRGYKMVTLTRIGLILALILQKSLSTAFLTQLCNASKMS